MLSILLALSSSLFLILAFPTFDFSLLAWVGLAPLFLATAEQPCRRAFALAFASGASFFLGVFSWILTVASFTVLDFVACGLFLGVYVGVFGLIFSWLRRNTQLPFCLIAPSLWITLEYLRAHAGFLSFPLGLLGHTQYRSPLFMQIAALAGVYGVSFLVVMTNAVLADLFWLWRRTREGDWAWKRLLTPVAMLGSMWSATLWYGGWMLTTPLPEEGLKVTVVQGNISQEQKWKREFRKRNLEAQAELTREAYRREPAALTIWPESSVPGSLAKDWSLASTIGALLKEINTPLLLGSFEKVPREQVEQMQSAEQNERAEEAWFNSASLAMPRHGIPGRYHKVRLLPFGEYLPLADVVPWPARLHAASRTRRLLPGSEFTVFDLDGRRFSVLICWENLFPELARTFVANGAEFLVNMTNEAWFGDSAASRQFLAISVFRAVENRVALVRAANTGISAFIDPYGRVVAWVQDETGRDQLVAGTLTHDVPLMRTRTFYSVYGDVWVGVNVAFLVIVICRAGVRHWP